MTMTTDELRADPYFDTLYRVIVEAGGIAIKEQRSGPRILAGHPEAVVTHVDEMVSSYIRRELARNEWQASYSGEEIPGGRSKSDLEVVIDGIDGTRNYADSIYGWSISVCVVANGVPTTGIVYDPYVDECYAGIACRGAFRRRRGEAEWRSLLVPKSLRRDFSFSVGSFRDPAFTEVKQAVHARMKRLGGRSREWGSVALSFCAVASGGFGAYIQPRSFLHDHIAGALIANEAGARIIEHGGESEGRINIAACHPSLADDVYHALAEALGGGP